LVVLVCDLERLGGPSSSSEGRSSSLALERLRPVLKDAKVLIELKVVVDVDADLVYFDVLPEFLGEPAYVLTFAVHL
jgi:hypothetical protein